MRQAGKIILQRVLRRLARRVLTQQRPQIVAVTGSVGKTTTVQACALVLAAGRRVRASVASYNNELGVPLTVVGGTAGGKSLRHWIRVLGAGMRLAWRRDSAYPELLVLELGADRPGDLAYLLEWLHPRVGVVTGVSATHLEFFGGVSAVAEEKAMLPRWLSRDGLAVLNADDPLVLPMRQRTAARVLTYGFGPSADVRGSEISYAGPVSPDPAAVCAGMRGVVRYAGLAAPLDLPHVLGQQLVYPALAAVGVGVGMGVSLETAAARLRQFVPPPGRMRVIAGIKGTTIVDDSYNSSPLAAQAAVRVLALLPGSGGRKFAALGDMRELGAITARAHRELGGQVARAKIGTLVCVGELARDIARGASDGGMPDERLYTFPDAASAGRFLQDRIASGDVVLVKGSQAVRMERIVKELMAEPLRASELLVRQGPEWGSG